MKNSLLLILILLIPYFIFSQDIVKEDIELKNREIQLPGTLSHLKTEEKIPLTIFVHGSGNIDRNGNQPGTPIQADYIKSLADSLNAKGIAFYRYDKRTSVPANLDKLVGVTIDDFVADAEIAIANFKNDSRFSSIHIIGHSQGSLVAMLALSDAVKSYISIAGAGQTIDKTIIDQLKVQSGPLSETASEHLTELMQTDTILNIDPFLAQLFSPQNQKFLKHWMSISPTTEIKKITVPTLLINGDSDLQIKAEDAKELNEALPASELIIIPKMNHVLKEVNSIEENQKSYTDKIYPLSGLLIEKLCTFIKSKS